jgi:exopolysaccharide biosynthesis polyprenyl glycosylphosphotransferase
MDRAVAALLLVLAAPVFVAIAVAIVLEDRGPVFYTQRRVGANGMPFQMIKFRSMVIDAESRRAGLLQSNEVEGGTLFKLAQDPRVTRIGATLRRYSIDELPQLLNVLGGSMSLVGPRPPLPEEVATYADDARRRLLVRPGMTGLWQVSGRSDLSWEESVKLDLRYVENWSMALDLTILWKTAGAVFTGRGAY